MCVDPTSMCRGGLPSTARTCRCSLGSVWASIPSLRVKGVPPRPLCTAWNFWTNAPKRRPCKPPSPSRKEALSGTLVQCSARVRPRPYRGARRRLEALAAPRSILASVGRWRRAVDVSRTRYQIHLAPHRGRHRSPREAATDPWPTRIRQGTRMKRKTRTWVASVVVAAVVLIGAVGSASAADARSSSASRR